MKAGLSLQVDDISKAGDLVNEVTLETLSRPAGPATCQVAMGLHHPDKERWQLLALLSTCRLTP